MVAGHDIHFRVGRGQYDRWDRFQPVILLDKNENLPPIHFRKIKIQQNKIRARGIGVGALAPQELHRLDAVHGYVQADEYIRIAENFLCQPDIARTVFNQENL